MLSVYNFRDPVDFLSSYISDQKEKNESFSLKSFSNSLGLNSPAPIIDILRRNKKIKDRIAAQISNHLNIDASERMYFEALVAKNQADSEEKVRMYDLIIEELSPNTNQRFKSIYTDKLSIFSHWIYMAILSLSEIKDFELNVENIQEKLIEEIDREQVEKTLFDLYRHGLLKTDENGKTTTAHQRTMSCTDTPHQEVSHYYKMVCELAKKAVHVPLNRREFNAFSISINESDVPLAKEIVRKCRSNLGKLSNRSDANQVYQVNLMLFPMTE